MILAALLAFFCGTASGATKIRPVGFNEVHTIPANLFLTQRSLIPFNAILPNHSVPNDFKSVYLKALMTMTEEIYPAKALALSGKGKQFYLLPESVINPDVAAIIDNPPVVHINAKPQMGGVKIIHGNRVEGILLYNATEKEIREAYQSKGKAGLLAKLNQIFDSNAPAVAAPVIYSEKERAINNYAALFKRGLALQEDPATTREAIAAYQKILDLDPNDTAARINLGVTLTEILKQHIEAEKHFRKAIKTDPMDDLAHYNLGVVLSAQHLYEEAIKAYKAALLLEPEYADAHYNIALDYQRLKQFDEALPHWLAFIELAANKSDESHAYALKAIRFISKFGITAGNGSQLKLYKDAPELAPHHRPALIGTGAARSSGAR